MNPIHRLAGTRTLHNPQVAPEPVGGKGRRTVRASGSPLRRHPLPLACTLALAAGMLALPAWAGTFTVTQSSDDGTGTTPGSLSWAIDQAILNPGSTIVIAAGTGSITESGTLPALGQGTTIQGALAIVGPGAAPLSIKPAGAGAITVQNGDGTAAGVGAVAGANGSNGANATAPGVAGGAGGAGIGAVAVTGSNATLANNGGSSLTGGNGGSGGNGGNGNASVSAGGNGGAGGSGGTAVAASGSVLTNNGSIAGGTGGNGGSGGSVVPPGRGGNGGNGGAGIGGSDFVLTNNASISGGRSGLGGFGGFGAAYSGTGGNGGNGGAGVTGSGFTVTNHGGIYGGFAQPGGAGGGVGDTIGPGGNGGAGGAGVSGTSFTLINDNLIAGRAGADGGSGSKDGNGGDGGAGVSGTGFRATNNGSIFGAGGGNHFGGESNTAGTGGAGVGGHGFTLTNNGTITAGYGGVGGAAGGYGGAGVGGTGFTLTNSGSITGGAGGGVLAASGTGGNGGGGVSGAGFTLTNAAGGTITGGNGGSSGGTGGNGGAGIVSTGGARVTTNGSIVGGTGAGGQADAIDFSGGGNMLTLENSIPPAVPPLYSFTGNVVSTSGVGAAAIHGGDTLALSGDTTNPAGNDFDLGEVVATPTNWTGTVQYAGFNKFEKTGSSTWQVFGAATFAGGSTVRAGTLQMDNNASLNGSTLTVEAGATLDGQPLLFAPTIIEPGATLLPGTPGNPNSMLFADPLSMLGKLAIAITSAANGSLTVAGAAATLGNTSFFDFALDTDTSQHAGDTFQFFDADSFINFTDIGNHFHCSGLMAGLGCMLSMNAAGNGLLLTLDGVSHSVPEPGSLGMFGLGLVLLGGGIAWRMRPGRREG